MSDALSIEDLANIADGWFKWTTIRIWRDFPNVKNVYIASDVPRVYIRCRCREKEQYDEKVEMLERLNCYVETIDEDSDVYDDDPEYMTFVYRVPRRFITAWEDFVHDNPDEVFANEEILEEYEYDD